MDNWVILCGIVLYFIYVYFYKEKDIRNRYISAFLILITGLSIAFYEPTSPFIWILVLLAFIVLFTSTRITT